MDLLPLTLAKAGAVGWEATKAALSLLLGKGQAVLLEDLLVFWKVFW